MWLYSAVTWTQSYMRKRFGTMKRSTRQRRQKVSVISVSRRVTQLPLPIAQPFPLTPLVSPVSSCSGVSLCYFPLAVIRQCLRCHSEGFNYSVAPPAGTLLQLLIVSAELVNSCECLSLSFIYLSHSNLLFCRTQAPPQECTVGAEEKQAERLLQGAGSG